MHEPRPMAFIEQVHRSAEAMKRAYPSQCKMPRQQKRQEGNYTKVSGAISVLHLGANLSADRFNWWHQLPLQLSLHCATRLTSCRALLGLLAMYRHLGNVVEICLNASYTSSVHMPDRLAAVQDCTFGSLPQYDTNLVGICTCQHCWYSRHLC